MDGVGEHIQFSWEADLGDEWLDVYPLPGGVENYSVRGADDLYARPLSPACDPVATSSQFSTHLHHSLNVDSGSSHANNEEWPTHQNGIDVVSWRTISRDLPETLTVPIFGATPFTTKVVVNGKEQLLSITGRTGSGSSQEHISKVYYHFVSRGDTSKIIGVNAVLSPKTGFMPRKHIKLAVKRLSGGLSGSNDFAREYENLYRVARARHPWLVNLIGAFMKSEGSIGRYNLVFPLPIGNLEQLFDGSTRHASLLTWKDTLWGQFQGLADALRCLHDECHLVHANLKASNILVHERSGDSNLIAQIADFSLANGLQNVPARLSRRFRGNDVWFLGVVFAELLTFLVRGHRGIVRIRSWFPRTWGQSTWENNKPFPYREGVRRKVMEWLTRLSSDSTRAQEIAKAIILTLSNAGSMPSAADVAAAFLKTSTVLLSDGRRIVQFILSADCPEPSWFDKARATVEGLIGAPVDWWPAPPVLYKCPPDSTRIKWKWHRHDLYVDLPTGLVQSYKEKCCRPLSSIPQSALLPQFVTAPGTTTTTNLSQSGASNTPSQGSANVNSGQQQGAGSSSATIMSALPNTTSSKLSQIYWCVDKAWIEPLETWLCIENSQHSADDRELCARLRKLYDSVRGIRGRLLSWKTCLGIRFVRFNRLYDKRNLVICMGVGLPKPPQYEYTLFQPELVHMAIASKQILAGMHNPAMVEGSDTVEMIPKKVDALLEQQKGAEGWGLHAVQGWSLYKIVVWMGTFTLIGLLFVMLWLVLVDPKDLQNAFAPGMFLAAMLCLAVGVPQVLDAA